VADAHPHRILNNQDSQLQNNGTRLHDL
jgi:hypothetical protein